MSTPEREIHQNEMPCIENDDLNDAIPFKADISGITDDFGKLCINILRQTMTLILET